MARPSLTPEQMAQIEEASVPSTGSHQPNQGRRSLSQEEMDSLDSGASLGPYEPKSIPDVPGVEVSPLESAAVSAGNYLNLIPRGRAVAAGLGGLLKGNGFSGPANQELQQSQQVISEAGRQHPFYSFAGGVVGNIPLAMAGGKVAGSLASLGGSGYLPTALRASAAGGLAGLATAPSANNISEAFSPQLEQRATQGGFSALTAGALSVPGKYLVDQAATSTLAKTMRDSPNKVRDMLRDKIGLSVDALNAEDGPIANSMRAAEGSLKETAVPYNTNRLLGFKRPQMNPLTGEHEMAPAFPGYSQTNRDTALPGDAALKVRQELDELAHWNGRQSANLESSAANKLAEQEANNLRAGIAGASPGAASNITKAEQAIKARNAIDDFSKSAIEKFGSNETKSTAAAMRDVDEMLGNNNLTNTMKQVNKANSYNAPVTINPMSWVYGLGNLAARKIPGGSARIIGDFSSKIPGLNQASLEDVIRAIALERAKASQQ